MVTPFQGRQRDAYTSQAWFDLEMRHVVGGHWTFAGFATDWAEPGDVRLVHVGQDELLVVQQADGTLKALHNMCRHRGIRLVQAEHRAKKSFVCPYHSWTYGLDGSLKGVPEQAKEFPDLDKSCMGLLEGAVDTYRGMVFVHPNADPTPLSAWFAELDPHIGPHDPTKLVEAKDQASETVIEANWKIVVENFIDAYHLRYLHSGTLPMYDHKRIEAGAAGPHVRFYEPVTADYAENLDARAPSPLIPEVPRDQAGAWVPWLFPTLGLSATESTFTTFRLHPVSPSRTIVRTRTLIANAGSWAASKQWWSSGSYWQGVIRPKVDGDPATNLLATADLMSEDKYVCEALQANLTNSRFNQSASARTGEAPVRHFQQMVLDRLPSV